MEEQDEDGGARSGENEDHGQVVAAAEDDNDPNFDGEDSIRFFRFRDRLPFDSTCQEEMEVFGREEIDYMNGDPPQGWQDRQLKKFVYIDDYNCIEQVRHRDAIFDIGEAGRTTEIHAPMSEEIFCRLQTNAEKIGMKVNPKKTQALCITSAKNMVCSSYINDPNGGKIKSSNKLKILGFYFNTTPSPQAQIDRMVRKVRMRLWMLRYLKTAGLPAEDLCVAYITHIRSVMEYSAPAFHSMLTKEQSKQLEVQQARSLKIIYGFDKPYSALLSISGLKTLQERRSKLTDNFAVKLKNNPRFTHLFPRRPGEQLRARNPNVYVEEPAATSRLYNSPIFYMRRRLNQLERENQTMTSRAHVQANTGTQRCDFIFDEWR